MRILGTGGLVVAGAAAVVGFADAKVLPDKCWPTREEVPIDLLYLLDADIAAETPELAKTLFPAIKGDVRYGATIINHRGVVCGAAKGTLAPGLNEADFCPKAFGDLFDSRDAIDAKLQYNGPLDGQTALNAHAAIVNLDTVNFREDSVRIAVVYTKFPIRGDILPGSPCGWKDSGAEFFTGGDDCLSRHAPVHYGIGALKDGKGVHILQFSHPELKPDFNGTLSWGAIDPFIYGEGSDMLSTRLEYLADGFVCGSKTRLDQTKCPENENFFGTQVVVAHDPKYAGELRDVMQDLLFASSKATALYYRLFINEEVDCSAASSPADLAAIEWEHCSRPQTFTHLTEYLPRYYFGKAELLDILANDAKKPKASGSFAATNDIAHGLMGLSQFYPHGGNSHYVVIYTDSPHTGAPEFVELNTAACSGVAGERTPAVNRYTRNCLTVLPPTPEMTKAAAHNTDFVTIVIAGPKMSPAAKESWKGIADAFYDSSDYGSGAEVRAEVQKFVSDKSRALWLECKETCWDVPVNSKKDDE